MNWSPVVLGVAVMGAIVGAVLILKGLGAL